MEDTLWAPAGALTDNQDLSLNPYSNGRYSMGQQKTELFWVNMSLNPYSNGRYSMGFS